MQDLQEFSEAGGLEALSAFVTVAESGSFAAAARALGRDASVLSRRVSGWSGALACGCCRARRGG
ncbi:MULTISPECIES: LysR family transcriptional regulator [unclassified Methylobacterium]|uniref:helix-turn-helix domain-containing protein n=1 Tax=unclassified Methylobacterium TaxID=2615210 RepID=UPI003701EC0B